MSDIAEQLAREIADNLRGKGEFDAAVKYNPSKAEEYRELATSAITAVRAADREAGMVLLFKVTNEDGSARNGGSGKWQLNRWRALSKELVPCSYGLHLCRRQDLTLWLGPVIWRAEYEGELVTMKDKVVVRRARVVERLDTWNETTARLFAADCAEHVLPIFGKVSPDDDRPRRAIEAARSFARGQVGRDELDAAWAAASDAAWAAARDAAWTAASAAASDAASAAAWTAAWTAAWAAAWAAASAAAWAARAAWDAEAEWQTGRLFDYLEGRAS